MYHFPSSPPKLDSPDFPSQYCSPHYTLNLWVSISPDSEPIDHDSVIAINLDLSTSIHLTPIELRIIVNSLTHGVINSVGRGYQFNLASENYELYHYSPPNELSSSSNHSKASDCAIALNYSIN